MSREVVLDLLKDSLREQKLAAKRMAERGNDCGHAGFSELFLQGALEDFIRQKDPKVYIPRQATLKDVWTIFYSCRV